MGKVKGTEKSENVKEVVGHSSWVKEDQMGDHLCEEMQGVGGHSFEEMEWLAKAHLLLEKGMVA